MPKNLDRGLMLLAALIFVLAPLFVRAQDENQPKVVIEKMRHDFGEVFEQEHFKHTFEVKNEGTADLEIKSVRPG